MHCPGQFPPWGQTAGLALSFLRAAGRTNCQILNLFFFLNKKDDFSGIASLS